jgi:CHAT domain-containing protein
MTKYLLILFLLAIVFACNHNTASKKKFLKIQSINIDSFLIINNTDSNKIKRIVAINHLISSCELDSLSMAKLYLNIFLNDTFNTIKRYNILNYCIDNEKKFATSPEGRKILAEHYAKRVYKWKQENKFNFVIEDCEKFKLYTNAQTDSQYKFEVLIELGNTYERMGDTKNALINLENALGFAKKINNHTLILYASTSLSNSFGNNNEIAKAIEVLNEATKYKNISDNDKDYLMMCRVNFMDNDNIKIKAVENLIKNTKNNYAKFYCLLILTDYYYDQSNYKKAISFALEATKVPEQEKRMIAKRYFAIGNYYRQLNKIDSASYYYNIGLKLVVPVKIENENVVPIYDSINTENTIFDICMEKSDLILNKKTSSIPELKSAIILLLSAQQVAKLIRKQLVFDESKYKWGVDLKTVSEILLKCYYQLYIKTKDQQYAKLAFMVAEDNKATALLDYTEHNILAYQQSDTNYAKYIELRKQLNDVEIQIKETNTEQEKENLQMEYNDLVIQLGMYKSLSNTSLMIIEKEKTYEDINKYLQKNNCNALSYFVGEEKVYFLLINSANHQIQFTQCDTTIKDSVQALCNLQNQENIYSAQKNRFVPLSNYVFRTIFGNIVSLDKNKTTIVLTDGVLNNLAFDALITDTNKINSFLIKQNKMSFAYSIKSLINQQQRTYSNQKSILISAPFTQTKIRNLPPLQSSNLEVNNLAKQYATQSFTNTTATFTNFKNGLANNNYIHIASHATAGETPKLEFYDSSVYVNSIYQIPMTQSLAYLNTCQSGSGINYYSEGNLSLGRAFYSNGVHNIVLTLWNMNDASTAMISNLFYKNIQQTNNSITALHEAKLNYLENQPMDKQAPYYWASLQHVGDGGMGQQGALGNWWKWMLGSLVIGGCVWWWRKRRG